MRTQYSAPPTHHADLLAHYQSENPMAQMSDGPPPQTSHAQSDPTTSARLQKLPTQLNKLKIFAPDLIRVSPNALDIQRLGQCVGALNPLTSEGMVTHGPNSVVAGIRYRVRIHPRSARAAWCWNMAS